MWTETAPGFTSLGYFMLQVTHYFFSIWYFSLSIFPSLSRTERGLKSTSHVHSPAPESTGWAPSLPLLGPRLQSKRSFALVPACPIATRQLWAGPVALSGVELATGLFSSPGSMLVTHYLVHLLDLVLSVMFGSLPFLLLLEVSPLPHLICFQLPCLGSTARCSSLFFAPPPHWIIPLHSTG